MATLARPTLRACAAFCALALAACASTRMQRRGTTQTTQEIPILNTIDTSTMKYDAGTWQGFDCPPVVSRQEWGAAKPKLVEWQEGPSAFVIVHHTYTPGACNTSAACEAAMRSMQRFHQVDRGWNDIGYNFAVGGDGRVYQGRGWQVRGAHAPLYNHRSIGIALIGDWMATPPPAEMAALAQQLIACSVRRGSLTEDFQLMGHRQVRDTLCPGDAFYEQLSVWPHWVPQPDAPLPTAATNATNTIAAVNATAAPGSLA